MLWNTVVHRVTYSCFWNAYLLAIYTFLHSNNFLYLLFFTGPHFRALLPISSFLITSYFSLEPSDRFIDQRSHSLSLRQLKLFLILAFFFCCCGFRLSENLKSMSEVGGGLGPYRPP